MQFRITIRMFMYAPLWFEAFKFWDPSILERTPILVDWGSQGPLIFKASGNPVNHINQCCILTFQTVICNVLITNIFILV